MDIRFTAVLHSNYSSASARFLETLHSLPANLQLQLKPALLCIDSEQVRLAIQNSSLVQVSVVPCIIIAYNDGGVEKFEGETAFKWLESVRSGVEADAGPGELERMAARLAEMEKLLQAEPPVQPVEPTLERRARHPAGPVNRKQPAKSKPMHTSLESLPELGEEEEYEYIEEEEDDPVMEGSKNALQQKQDSLQMTAADLQKEREMMEDAIIRKRR